ncbi:MAG: nucleoside-diphosphate kinase [Candidatus Magasanikbacteria bacterium]|nr:nucleoside-diphosphate kinase [Candidatus Magasanikbacteria bacterium]
MNIPHPKKERTFIMIKPDGVQRSLIGEIIKRFERTGLKLVALKMFIADEKRLWTHYDKDDAWYELKGDSTIKNRQAAGMSVEKTALEYGKDIVRALVKFMSCGPVVAMVWEGNEAVGIVKKIVGATEPLSSDVGTLRGDLTLDSYSLSNIDGRAVRNLVHCSDKPEEAVREMNIWFKGEDVINYNHVQDEILYDVNLDGILE